MATGTSFPPLGLAVHAGTRRAVELDQRERAQLVRVLALGVSGKSEQRYQGAEGGGECESAV